MSDTVLGALIALCGVIVGILGNALHTRGQSQREKRSPLFERTLLFEHRQKRLEQLYILLRKHLDAIEAAREALIESLRRNALVEYEPAKAHWAEISMLADLYAPELASFVLDMEYSSERFNRLLAEIAAAIPVPTRDDRLALHDRLEAGFSHVASGVHDYLAEIAQIAGGRAASAAVRAFVPETLKTGTASAAADRPSNKSPTRLQE